MVRAVAAVVFGAVVTVVLREGLAGGSADEIFAIVVIGLVGEGGRRFAALVVVFVGIVAGSGLCGSGEKFRVSHRSLFCANISRSRYVK